MNDKDRELLIEQATTAYRPRDRAGAVVPHPAFLDLDATGRQALHGATERLRLLEAGLDPLGLSTTAHAVLARIRGA
ncbi:MAG: hypothetical protein FJ265_22715 [Planctomycetes bacterium]|nr:hypothetical protein [Planctomycetota bacterium]